MFIVIIIKLTLVYTKCKIWLFITHTRARIHKHTHTKPWVPEASIDRQKVAELPVVLGSLSLSHAPS